MILILIIIILLFIIIGKKETFKTTNDLKIGICFYGLTRSLEYTIDSINSNIFDVLKDNNIEYDVYLHTYDLDKIHNPRTGEYDNLNKEEYKLLNPYKYKKDNQDLFDKKTNYNEYFTKGNLKRSFFIIEWEKHDNYITFKNLIRALNSQKEVTKLWNNSDKEYDIILYLRPDLKYNKLDINQFYELMNMEQDKRDKVIYIPTWHDNGGYNDRLAFGTPKVMKIYGHAFDDLLEYSKRKRVQSESFNKYRIKNNMLKRHNFKLRGKRIRSNGITNKKDNNLYK